jgi:hypothetical protein
MTWLERLRQDPRFGARNLARTPAVTGIAVLSLALGIMATTAIYSVIHGVIVDPFPYRDVDRLMSVKVWEPGARGFRTAYSTDEFLEIAERSTIFEGVIASTISDVLWTGEGEPQRLRGNYVTTNTFQVMECRRSSAARSTAAEQPTVFAAAFRRSVTVSPWSPQPDQWPACFFLGRFGGNRPR